MTEKEIANRLDAILAEDNNWSSSRKLTEGVKKLRDELATPRPKPGTVVWWRFDDGDPWQLWKIGIVYGRIGSDNAYGVLDYNETRRRFDKIQWKPAYVAPPNTDPGTAALIDELQNRIAELEERQLAPDEVAVKVPPLSEWPMGGEALNMYIGSDPGPVVWRIITRTEAEEMHRE